MNRVLILEPAKSVRKSLCELIKVDGLDVLGVENPDEAESAAEAAEGRGIPFDLFIFNSNCLPKAELLERIAHIVLTEQPSIDEAFKFAHEGACDYITKPYDMNRIMRCIRTSLSEQQQQTNEEKKPTRKSRRRTSHCCDDHLIVGESKQIDELRHFIEKIAPTDARVMILGENGTGKELVTRCIHEKSRRADAPFVEVNCAAIPSELIESELFGHEKGAFTSAIKQRRGKFEQADGGTLFLDEIGDMSLAAQAKVLRALQERKITRVGSDRDIDVDVRVIAATNKDIRAEIAAGNFREDLYHRLSVIEIRVVALRERSDDIPILVDHFLHEICTNYKIDCKKITSEAIEMLKHLNWSGNIRQLHNAVERLIILSEKTIEAEDVRIYCGNN